MRFYGPVNPLRSCQANSVDPDQTAPYEQFDQGIHYLLRHFCPNLKVNMIIYLKLEYAGGLLGCRKDFNSEQGFAGYNYQNYIKCWKA